MRDANVDLAILEVGLGGRLDATNAIDTALCSAIVTIGRDHTKLLGEDDASIAREKAGILRADTPLVLGALSAPARDAVLAIARERGAGPIWIVGSEDAGVGIRIRDPLGFDTPDDAIDAYVAHRRAREAQVLDALAAGPLEDDAIVDAVYGDMLHAGLRDAARGSVRAYLDHLARGGRVRRHVGGRWARSAPAEEG